MEALLHLNTMSSVWLCVLYTWLSFVACNTEEDLFRSVEQERLKWTSDPLGQWKEVTVRIGSESPVPVYQACAKKTRRTLLSHWIGRKDARRLLLDIAFAQEEEQSSNQLSPLQIYLFESDRPLARFDGGQKVLELLTSKPFPVEMEQHQISDYLNRSSGLDLGPVRRRGFHIGFSYSGVCVFLASVRLYYKRCPDLVEDLSRFSRTGAGSGTQAGSCVPGAVQVSVPLRECQVDGVWGLLQGGCVCGPGHQPVNNTCQACKTGHYKPANESGECLLCPPNSRTDKEGAEHCDCLHGYNRLPTDPVLLGCTKHPSAPLNLSLHHHNDTMLSLLWNPPHDRGGRREVFYDVRCLQKVEATTNQWEQCGQGVVIHPGSSGLTGTAVNITGLNPRSDYTLSVYAWNDVSVLQGTSALSTTTVTIQRWKSPEIITVAPALTVTEPWVSPVPQGQSRPSLWLIMAVVVGGGLLLVIVISAVFTVRRSYAKLTVDLDMELLPTNPGVSYRHPDNQIIDPQPVNVVSGVAQMLEGFSERLLASLKDVLVEQEQLTLGKELGKGQFGLVYEGIFSPEEGQNIKVAVKTMKVGIHSQEELHEFLREAELMKNFDHENVVKLLGVSLRREQDSPLPVPLVILPFMQHGDLRRFLIATRYGDVPLFVPHQSLLGFMLDIAEGMDYLSSKGFLHRDLAARNCMLGDGFRVCVADFGLSKKIYSNNYYRQRVVITVPIKWLALESLSESIYSTKSDVWSFGVTMWEIVSRGRTPYPGVHNHEVLDLLVSGHRPKRPEDCDDALYEVMQTCWHRDPSQRPSFRVLAERLRALRSQLPVLEPNQEAHYINQGLEAAASQGEALNHCPDMEHHTGAVGNSYLPAPSHAPPTTAKQDRVEVEEEEQQQGEGGAVGNSYAPSPGGGVVSARRKNSEGKDDEDEGGYLLFVKSGSAVKDCHS